MTFINLQRTAPQILCLSWPKKLSDANQTTISTLFPARTVPFIGQANAKQP